MPVDTLGCFARYGGGCRACGGVYKGIGPDQVKRIVSKYILYPDGRLMDKKTGTFLSLCGPIEGQIIELLRREGGTVDYTLEICVNALLHEM